MKKLLFLLFVLSVSAVVFAADVSLVKFYNNSVESHACKPGEVLCGYTNNVFVDSTVFAPCGTAGAVRVLGLSDPTNAHAETNAFTNYRDYNICLASSYFSSNCYYSAKGAACNAGAGYACSFGLSDFSNAHLSSCNTFGAEEVKLCCKPVIVSPSCPSTINFFTDKSYYVSGENIVFSYQCLGGSPVSFDSNILVGPDNLNFFQNGANQCDSSVKTFTINSSSLNLGGLLSKDFSSVIVRSNNTCPSASIAFNVSATGTPPIIGPGGAGDCNILKFEAQKSFYDSNVSILYSCHYDNLDANLVIFDPLGNVLSNNTGLNCSTAEKIFNNYKVPSSISGNPFFARLSVGKCVKDSFFPVTKAPEENTTIPDNNIFALLAVIAAVVLIVSSKSGGKK